MPLSFPVLYGYVYILEGSLVCRWQNSLSSFGGWDKWILMESVKLVYKT